MSLIEGEVIEGGVNRRGCSFRLVFDKKRVLIKGLCMSTAFNRKGVLREGGSFW